MVLQSRDGEHIDTTMLVTTSSCGIAGIADGGVGVGMIARVAEELHWTALCSNDDMLFGMHDADGERCFTFICCYCCCWWW